MGTFIAGLITGAVIGFFAAALMAASSTRPTEEDLEKYEKELKDRRSRGERRKQG